MIHRYNIIDKEDTDRTFKITEDFDRFILSRVQPLQHSITFQNVCFQPSRWVLNTLNQF